VEERILLLALRGRDAEVIAQLLSHKGHACHICLSSNELADELAKGAGTALVTEESLAETDRGRLARRLEDQPPWSDFPFILLATKRSGTRPKAALERLEQLGNVVVLERPIHGETLTSAVSSALRGRRRQYEARRRLVELAGAEESLRQLNGSLETRIGQRTDELSHANNQLMQEIAERERAQAALVQSQKMEAVGQLTGGIAHDFNNLLTVIGGNLELIQRRAKDERIVRLSDFALQASDRAAKLTRQLLAFSRTQRLTLQPVDVNALIHGMNELLARAIGPQFHIGMRMDPKAAWALADANQVELAILNLAINARDAMPDGGALDISSRRETAPPDIGLAPGDYVVVRVRDTGSGIPKTLLDKVFDPFFTTKPIGKGTGLGLSQVYGIAQQSGGTVRIDSLEGRGTTVAIWLPVAGEQAPESEATVILTHAGVGGRERVLVVEDDPGVRRFIVECLEMLGYAVTEAAHGREGLARLGETVPDLMIVDFAMPGLNGVEVVNAARVTAPNLPIILATGYADMEAVHKVIDPERVLRKPFQIDDLERAVHRAMAEGAKAAIPPLPV
jgi:signal transduction histidine kinase/ActR/RegA family two-component response regulator